MSDTQLLSTTLASLLDTVGRDPLKTLLFEPIEPADLDEHLARLAVFVAPSYLPFMRDESGMMVLHLWPGRDLWQSPVLYVPDDAREARFVADQPGNLPTALWLWVGRYFKEKPDVLRQATETVATGLPVARAVPDPLWTILKESPKFSPTLWSPRADEYTRRAWELADVGHPFVGMPRFTDEMEASEVLPDLESFVASRPGVPELLAALLATRSEAKIAWSKEEGLTVLSAEAWRQLSCVIQGWWRKNGEGVCEWDCTLRNLKRRKTVLSKTPFAPLANHPEAYSGNDADGSGALIDVAAAFTSLGDHPGALRQLRNAATVALLANGGYTPDHCLRIARACDAVAPDSLAAAAAREIARVHHEGP
ncbi:MAG: hypothetical protein HGA45_29735 [Chloroflexales bacterium]|nr:hypothetical protein [Chloroflexales bacterium]